MAIRYQFVDVSNPREQARIQAVLEKAFASGEILSCPCPSVEAMVFETRRSDFQASISCQCGLMRPLYSSTPDTNDK